MTENRQALDLLAEWDRSPWNEIGRNDSPTRIAIRFAPDQIWFWLNLYRIKRWLVRRLG